jgi:alkylation response protein AidB-like acyl-CoA dehydrogenase
MELLHLAGTAAQKEQFLTPLAAGETRSCFAMTEPEFAGSNPVRMGTTAIREGNEYVINGHKWFTTAFDGSTFTIVMAVTDPEAAPHQRASMILVPTYTPGLQFIRNISIMGHPGSGWMSHSEIRFENVRVPVENLIGAEGSGFLLAQARLGPGRIHHCMRWMGICERAFAQMCRYAATREIEDGVMLGEKQMVQLMIAESRAEIDAAKLMVLSTALLMEKAGQKAAAEQVSAIKFFTAKVLGDVLDRAIQVHGGLGITDDTILAFYYREERAARIYDGTDETHKASLARRILKRYRV